ncbi:MAG: hypothetical protein K6E32_04325 [Lachnospiraceae bacterium]|nr:hypothetical protein [Lachnospiraceae bacterium]
MKNAFTAFLGTIGFGSFASSVYTILDQSYDLIVIDETETPLGAGPVGTNYYVLAVSIVVLAALVASFALWFTRRNFYKKRLLELRDKAGITDKGVPFSIKEIREAIEEAEANLSAVMM